MFYSVFGTPSQKHWYLQCFVKTHARNTVNTNEFNHYIFHGNKPHQAKTLLFCAMIFPKKVIFGPFLASEVSQNKEAGVPPPPPFHILNFKIFTTSKTWQFFEAQDASGASFFNGICDVLCTYHFFYTKKCNIKNDQKITKKQISPWCSAFLGSRPLPQTGPLPRAIFDGICDVLCTSSTPQKRAAFLPRGGVGGT